MSEILILCQFANYMCLNTCFIGTEHSLSETRYLNLFSRPFSATETFRTRGQ
jgi:hypothetical protein